MTGPRAIDLPIACTLDASDGAARLARWKALANIGSPSVQRVGNELLVEYEAAPGVTQELEALVVAERNCCSFAIWEIKPDPGHVILRIRADPAALDALTELFAA